MRAVLAASSGLRECGARGWLRSWWERKAPGGLARALRGKSGLFTIERRIVPITAELCSVALSICAIVANTLALWNRRATLAALMRLVRASGFVCCDAVNCQELALGALRVNDSAVSVGLIETNGDQARDDLFGVHWI